MRKISALNQAQASLLYNHYNTYYGKEYPTLTQLIRSRMDVGRGLFKRNCAFKSFGLNERNPYGERKKSRRLQHTRKLKQLGYKF
jgi:hypothetical protein